MCRELATDPVPAESLEKLIWAASRAPMGGRQLVRRIIVVVDPRLVRAVRQVTPSLLTRPPVIVVLCTDLSVAEASMGRQGRDLLSLNDSGAAAENVALAAVALGLGVCLFRSSNEAALREVLDIPPQVRVDMLIAVGFPSKSQAKAMKAPQPIVYRDTYGQDWGEG